MINVSNIKTTPPENFSAPVQKNIYEVLQKLAVPFWRIDCDPAVTMDDCKAIDGALKVKTVKNLLLCNRQQTAFYLFITPGDKPFVTKDFSSAMGISRVSFAPQDMLDEKLGVSIGATTALAMTNAAAKDVRLVFDKAVLTDEYIAFPDGTTTCYIKLKTDDLLHSFLPAIGTDYTIIF